MGGGGDGVNGRRVTLSGTWERPNTTPNDLTCIRKAARRMNIRRWMEDDITLPLIAFRATQAGWTEKTRRDPKLREGWFEVTLFVPCQYGMGRGRAKSRARVLLKWLAQDITCRPPKLTVTNMKVGPWERSA